MKHFLRYVIVALLFALAVSPAVSMAQYDTSGTTPSQRQRIHDWRQSSELQQNIATLGTTPIAAIPMPVLFGVAPSNLTPNFGDPRDGGTRTHEGEDIMAVKGTPVVSPTAAVVLRTDVFSGGATLFILQILEVRRSFICTSTVLVKEL